MSALVPSECRVALLAGGSSGEREISLASGKGALHALEEAGFEVTWIDPSIKDDLRKLIEQEFDVAFLCLHGKNGEDGTVQGLLEVLDIPYTCSGVQASSIAIDKAKSKILYEHAGIPTAPFECLNIKDDFIVDDIIDEIGIPCVVKPMTEGSALGVSIVDDSFSLETVIHQTFEIDDDIVIEKFISGTEVTAGVLGNDDLEPLPVIEIVPKKGSFYDFKSKYAPGGSDHICPARLEDDVAERVKAYAKKAHEALGCKGVSRSDFIIDENGTPWILETNTIPGMTPTSLLPDAAQTAGYSFPRLCTALIEFALE